MLTRSFCDLADLLDGRRVVVLSGAGCSTESGIPDYRGPDSERRARKPMLYQEFTRDPLARRRYWARSAVGWRRVADARPNAGHRALKMMEQSGLVQGIVTQNVDGLHQEAGSERVVELHGNLAAVVCLECGAEERREALQRTLMHLNPDWSESAEVLQPFGDAESAPDGDVELDAGSESAFQVAPCRHCGGVLKPDVVFFGENVPKERVDVAWELFDEAEVLLVAGSSLTVYSGYRFVLGAAQRSVPVGIINLGSTRGDEIARVRVHGRTGEVLPALSEALL